MYQLTWMVIIRFLINHHGSIDWHVDLYFQAAALESHYYIKTGELISLSEQFLIDCSMLNNGCSGGWTLNAYRSIRDIGMVTEESYPYEAEDKSCRANGTLFKGMGFAVVQQREDNIKAAVGELFLN